MKDKTYPGKPPVKHNLIAFAGTLLCAAFLRWSVQDIIWSLWISSLIFGYTSFIIQIVLTPFNENAWLLVYDRDDKPERSPVNKAFHLSFLNLYIFMGTFLFFLIFSAASTWIAITFMIAVIISALVIRIFTEKHLKGRKITGGISTDIFMSLPSMFFKFIFISLHFIAFHAIHGSFLNHFFPLYIKPEMASSMLVYFKAILRQVLSLYWPFLLFSAISRLPDLKAAPSKPLSLSSMSTSPYQNVIRMHLAIFVFAFFKLWHFESFFLYFILIFYFLPAKTVIGMLPLNCSRSTF